MNRKICWIAGILLIGFLSGGEAMMSDKPDEYSQEEKWMDIPVFPVDESGTKEIKVKKSLVFGLLLKSNLSTGYSWRLKEEVAGNVVRYLGVTVHDPGIKKSGNFGSGDTEKFVFESIGTGKIKLKFQYQRPWEKDKPPEKELIVSLIVEE